MKNDFWFIYRIFFIKVFLVLTPFYSFHFSQALITPIAVIRGLGNFGVHLIAMSGGHACAILDTGSVKCWGDNFAGQLGLGDTNNRGDGANEIGDKLPVVLLGTGRVARSLALGSSHSCAILDDNTVKCWGDNSSGQLGLGDTNNRGDGANEMGNSLPTVNLGTNRWARSIVAGFYHTCALLDDSSVKCWGGGQYGVLGQGDTNNRGDGASEMGDSLSAINLGTNRWVRSIAAGMFHNCALLDNGTTKCWGQNSSGQLGQGDTNHRGDGASEMGDSLAVTDLGTNRSARAIIAGADHNCAILDNGTVKCWGRNNYAQLGQGDTNNRGDGASEMGDSLAVTDLGTNRSARSIVAGSYFNCAILDNGTVKCWGRNDGGQLGQGDTAIRGDVAGEMGDSLVALSFGTNRTVRSLITGGAAGCTVLDNGTLKCWGLNYAGILGQGNTTARGDGANEMGDNLLAIKLGKSKTKIATNNLRLANNASPELFEEIGQSNNFTFTGGSHACVILEDGSVKCWGDNGSGKLGVGDLNHRGDGVGEMGSSLVTTNLGTNRTARSIFGRGNFTCALLDNGTVKCWGNSGSGQLGVGSTANRGDDASEMGDSLVVVDLGTNRTARTIATGNAHTCAILDNGSVKCWGKNDMGQLGLGDTNNRGDGASEMGDSLPVVDLGTNRTARSLALGDGFSCALLDNGTVKCWGDNQYGQLGQGDLNNRGDGASEMGDSLPVVDLGTNRGVRTLINPGSGGFMCALLDNSSIKCWGSNNVGQLGQNSSTNRGDGANEMGDNLTAINLGTGRTARSLVAGLLYVCALLDNNTVKCWGGNAQGQLGQGDTVILGNNANEMGDNLPTVNLGTGRSARSLFAGSQFFCAILDNGIFKCWGNNTSGQLGMGDTNHRGDAANEMGDNLRPLRLGR